jgi:hypothetical protein
MAFCCDYVSEQDFELNCAFSKFLFSLNSDRNRQLRLTKPYRWGRLLVHYPETLQVILLFETLLIHHLERAFPRLFARMAPLSQPWAGVNVSIAIFKVPW